MKLWRLVVFAPLIALGAPVLLLALAFTGRASWDWKARAIPGGER